MDLQIPLLHHEENARSFFTKNGCDGWLAYDFRHSNSLACQCLGIPPHQLLTRRFFYWFPAYGEPVKIVSGVEASVLQHLPGRTEVYRTWQELEEIVKRTLHGTARIAMEYSPKNGNPYVSKVDAGTAEFIRSFGVEIISSADLIQQLVCILSSKQCNAHLSASESAVEIMNQTWNWITVGLKAGSSLTEWQVQCYILDQIKQKGLVTDVPPLCAVNAHSADPHYCATESSAKVIRPDDFILIDLGCKLPGLDGIYADITHVAVAAKTPSAKHEEIFNAVRQARDAACTLVEERFEGGIPLSGSEVDRTVRTIIEEAGYGHYFIHRTGHNIGYHEHGEGAHLDSYETDDTRLLMAGSCFSIEPGIYLPGDFGIRLEHDVLIHLDGTVEMTGGMQHELLCLL